MTRRAIPAALARWIAEGRHSMGELVILPEAGGQFCLRHYLDATTAGLECFSTPEAAQEIAKYDAQGNFRPLKTAPNLRRGWEMRLATVDALLAALDCFYPAAAGTFHAFEQGRLRTVPLAETLGRQTGMYRVVNRLTPGQRDELAAGACQSSGGCLRTILWELEPGRPLSILPPEKFDRAHDQTGAGRLTIPLLCQEACNFLVAAGRPLAKQQPP